MPRSKKFTISISIIGQVLLAQNNELYYGYTLLGLFVFYKYKVDTTNASDVVILQFNMAAARNIRGVPGTGITKRYKQYEVHLLNERHSNRNRLITYKTWKEANEACKFIAHNTELVYNSQ